MLQWWLYLWTSDCSNGDSICCHGICFLSSFTTMYQVNSLNEDSAGFSVCKDHVDLARGKEFCSYFNVSVARVCKLYNEAHAPRNASAISSEPPRFCSYYCGTFINACSLFNNPTYYGDSFSPVCSVLNDTNRENLKRSACNTDRKSVV